VLKINYSQHFDAKVYYQNIVNKYFFVKQHEILQPLTLDGGLHPPYKKSTITTEKLFEYWKDKKIGDFDKTFDGITFEDLIIGDFERLQEIKRQLGKIKENKYIDFLFDYGKRREKDIKPFFEQHLDIATCYYCNIDYVNSYNTDDGKKNKFTLDHYYDQSIYSYLALSLYNFVPSCYSCNSKIKKTHEFTNSSPSSQNFDFNKKVKFKLLLSESCNNLNIKTKEDIAIPLKERYSNEYDKYIEVFKLNERYQAHKDIVFEMMQNAQLYPDSRLKELQDLTGIPFQQIKKDIFKLVEDRDLSKEPFSKLRHDISHELGLI
jgi:hypothetical protein